MRCAAWVLGLLVAAGCGDGGGHVWMPVDATPPADVLSDPDGVVGRVADVTGAAVAGGAVVFVPASDVAALPFSDEAVDSTDDEPLEDLIAASGGDYPSAEVDDDGTYRLDALADGAYFLTYVPAPDATRVLPGGSECRIARDAGELRGAHIDLTVSSAPPADATFLGSYWCVACHPELAEHTASTAHRLGIWSPYDHGALQTAPGYEQRQAFDSEFAAGTTIYFHDFDGARGGFDKYQTTETSAGAVSFTATLIANADGYAVSLHNVANPADPDRVLRVDAAYGGLVFKQRYLTRVADGDGSYLAVLPLQYQHAGREDAVYGRGSKTWRDYHGEWWYDEDARLFTTPPRSRSFEKNCVSCHAASALVSGSDDTAWTIAHRRMARTAAPGDDSPLATPWADFDYDGDGVRDEMNVGCETCHGPGSAHWAAAGGCNWCHGARLPRGARPRPAAQIVSPALLAPGRAGILCGQCHSRPKGSLGSESPVDDAGEMMRAGETRHAFLAEHAVNQLDGATKNFYADERRHSKSHHQQYSDHIQSRHYKNGRALMVCFDCHDPHGTPNEHDLRFDPNDNDAACNAGGCHAPAQTAVDHEPAMCAVVDTAPCVQCHMPATAKTGAGEPGLVIDGVQYWQNDIRSHIFDVPDKASSLVALPGGEPGLAMPTGYTDSCAGTCHVLLP